MNYLKELYRRYYYISPLDQADSAESNRLFNVYWSAGWFFVLLGFFIASLILFRGQYYENRYILIVLGLCILDLLISFFLSIAFKNVAREKAYIVKNIPVYLIYLVCGFSGSILLFYTQENHYNGLILFISASNALLCVISITLPFFIIITASFFVMLPGVFQFWGVVGVINFIFLFLLTLIIAFVNRFRTKRFLSLIAKQKTELEVKTFGNFTILYNKKVVKFTRSKSTELLAYLIYKNGSSLNTKELIPVLYGDHADSSRYGASLRLLIYDIKHTLEELKIQNFFIAEYNSFRINPEVVKCDYYDFLAGDQKTVKSFTGEFMSQYSWAEDTAAFLERKALK